MKPSTAIETAPALPRKTRPYLFYDTTQSVCTQCLRGVEAKILFKDNKVYMDKWCPAHGTERVLVSDDQAYYRLCREVFIKPPEMPARFATPMQYGCPYDCGLCPDHMQHSCLSVVEITDNCNLRCPTCYAESGPERLTHKSYEEVLCLLDAVVASEGEADVVQISGGEPTQHPDFFKILDAARARPIKHLMLNTNGLRIAQDPEFAARLKDYGSGFEVYLQFDSFEREALMNLRGADLRRIREQAVERLNALDISTTLVMTVKRGVNDSEIGAVIAYAAQQPCVRGVTLQPVQDAGRVETYEAGANRLTLSEIRRRIAEQNPVFSLTDIVPVPCNPDNLAMAYALKTADGLQPLTGLIDPQTLIEDAGNTIVFERDEQLKQYVFKLFATNHSPESQANCLSELLCCLPGIDAPDLSYKNVFRVLIVQFMDALSLDIRALKKSCIHIAALSEDGKARMIPFESYNLFYRDGKQCLLKEIQQEIAANTAMRRAPTGAETGASTKVQIQRVAMPISTKKSIKKRYPKADSRPNSLNPTEIACWPCTIEASTTFLEIDMTHTFRNRIATSLRQLAVPFALSAALFVHAPAQAAGLNDASMNVSLIPVGSVIITASVVAASADSAANASKTVFNEVGSFVVRSVNASARGTVYVLERASDGARYSVEIVGKGLKASTTAVGAVVSSTVVASGVMLVSAGEVLAFIPNAIGQALLHNERLTF